MNKQRNGGDWLKGVWVYKDIVKLFSLVCTTAMYTMKLHLLDLLVDDVRRFGDMSVLDDSPYEQLSFHIKSAYQGPSRGRAAVTQETVVLMGWQCRSKQDALLTVVESSFYCVVHRRFCKYIEEVGRFV